MKQVYRVIAVTLAIAAALVLAGCSSSSSSSAQASAQSSSSAASQASEAVPSASSASASAAATASSSSAAAPSASLANGEYEATFGTDSSMFHVNEADKGKGVLTVSDEGMSIHVRLASKKIVNLFAGMASEAKADGAQVIEPTTETVTLSDGTEEEVYAFDIPVPGIGEEFDVAILGEKGKWYDHKVSVTDPVSK